MKLAARGIEGALLQWIENWLSGRKQRVVLNGQFLDWEDVLSGVPQGSVLGPLLFVIYINDIDDSVVCKILKFADDTKIYSSVGSATDIENLQSDLYKLISWSNWQMLFNIIIIIIIIVIIYLFIIKCTKNTKYGHMRSHAYGI